MSFAFINFKHRVGKKIDKHKRGDEDEDEDATLYAILGYSFSSVYEKETYTPATRSKTPCRSDPDVGWTVLVG